MPAKMGQRLKRALKWSVAVVLIAGPVLWLMRPFWHGLEVKTVGLTRGPLVETLVVSGRVRAANLRSVASTVSGRVAEVGAREGEEVRDGAMLVRLEDAEARAAVSRAQSVLAGLDVARRELDERRVPTSREALVREMASLAQARKDLARDVSLAGDGAIGASVLAQTELAVVLAESRVRVASVEIRAKSLAEASVEVQMQEAKAALVAAEAHLLEHIVRAPGAGVVLTRRVEVGEVIEPGRPLFELGGLPAHGRITLVAGEAIVIEPDETHLPKISVGQVALVSPEAFPELLLSAKVTRISDAIDVRRGTVSVYLSLGPHANGQVLKRDMSVSVELELSRKEDALTLPRQAVRDLRTAPWVMVARDGHASRVRIEVGLVGDTRVEIESGLDGDAVILLPSPDLPSDGAKIRVLPLTR
jgi:HlyD family secretion protein